MLSGRTTTKGTNMKKFLGTIGVAMLMTTMAAAATNAADNTEIKAEVTKATSSSRQTSSEVNVGGTWAVEKLAVGQQFTVSTVPNEGKAPFVWNASFPFTLDDGSVVGECAANEAELTCTVKEVPESYKDKTDVTGTWWARARLQGGAIGTTEGTITLNGKAVKTLVWGDKNGEGVCTNDCESPAHYEYANPENVKFGWSNADGTISWGIKWIAKGGVEYSVKDFDAKLGTTVKCAKSNTWNPDTTEVITATQVDPNTIKFTAPEGSKTCVTYPPEHTVVPEGQTSATNHAEVNGMKLEATATVKSNGGTNGDGSVKPTPAPAPSVTPEPTPTPSEDPKPEPSPSTPAPAPSTEPIPAPVPSTPAPSDEPQSVPSPKPSDKPASKPTPTAVESMNKPTVQNQKKDKLAKTGADFQTFVVIGIVGGLIGAAALTVSWCAGRCGRDRI
nr:MAG TPA: translation initiation factor-like protein [Caudoviricetes sp.]